MRIYIHIPGRERMSVLDERLDTLDQGIWESGEIPVLRSIASETIRTGARDLVGRIPVRSAYLVGSITGYRYSPESDIDVSLVVDLDDVTLEKLADRTKAINGRLVPGTLHPVNYYVVNKPLEFHRFDAVYDIIHKKWLKAPHDYGVDLYDVYDSFKRAVRGIDATKAEAFRSLVDINLLRQAIYHGGKPAVFAWKLKRRLNELNQAIDELVGQYDEVHQKRIQEFKRYEELAHQGIKPLPSPNLLPANIRYKLLERYHYLDFMQKLYELVQETDDIDTQEDLMTLQRVLGYKEKTISMSLFSKFRGLI